MPKPVSQIVSSGRDFGESSQPARDSSSAGDAWKDAATPDTRSAKRDGDTYQIADAQGNKTWYPKTFADQAIWIGFPDKKSASTANDLSETEARKLSDEKMGAGKEGVEAKGATKEVSDRMATTERRPKYGGRRA